MANGAARFLHPYYLAHAGLVLSWLVLRRLLNISPLQKQYLGNLMTGEIALFFSMTLYLYKKFKWCNNWESFFAKSFLYYQSLIVLMLFYISLSAMVWYALACVAFFVVFRPPHSSSHANILEMDDMNFEEAITTQKRGKDGVAWLVFFTADWHTECTFFSHIFAEMAERFGGTELIRFGRIDDRYKTVFEAHKVEANQWKAKSLPCVILFKNGVELLRLPPFNEKGNLIPTRMDLHGCIKAFGLEKRLEAAKKQLNSKKKT